MKLKIFQVCDNGYKYDRRIFWAIMGIIVLSVFFFAYSQDFDFSYKFYYNCDEPICNNPYSENTTWYNSVTGEKHYCTDDWCNRKLLERGEYGHKTPFFMQYFPPGTVLLVICGLLLNHFIHNKGKRPSIKPAIPDKIWNKLKEIVKEDDKNRND